MFNEKEVELGKTYFSSTLNDSVTFESIRFYLSNFEFLTSKKEVIELPKKHFLIDLKEPNSLLLETPKNLNHASVRFNLGIDSITNNKGALGGDLDPVNGMYWTWQSGYINFKLEGTSPAVSTRKNRFQFHLGGFLYPFNALQTVELNNKNEITLDLTEFFEQVDLNETNTIMSPSYEAVEISKKVANSFR